MSVQQEHHLAEVHDLLAARRARDARRGRADEPGTPATGPAVVTPLRPRPAADPMPVDVWAEVEAANRLFEDLAADGRRIVFDDGHLDGRLVISLCDLEGRVLRAVSPSELPGPALGASTRGEGAA